MAISHFEDLKLPSKDICYAIYTNKAAECADVAGYAS